jgi:hypothetical protein
MANWTLLVEKAWGAPGNEEWNNSYEIAGSGATSMSAIAPLIDQIIWMEREMHLTDVFFTRARVGAYLPSVSGYDPFRFFNIPIGLSGNRTRGAIDPADLELVWKVNRTPATGRPGMLNYRGVLVESDVTSAQTGRPKINGVFVGPSGGAIADMRIRMGPYMGTAPNIFLAMIGEYRVGGTPSDPIMGPTVVRRVSALTVFGAGRLKLTKRAYQRPGADVGDQLGGNVMLGPPNTAYNYAAVDEDPLRDYDWTFDDDPPQGPL